MVICMLFIYELYLYTGKDKLSKSVAEQKWDKVKLVCTQPYNKVHSVSNFICW